MSLQQKLADEVGANVDLWVHQVLTRVRNDVPAVVGDATSAELAESSTGALLSEFALALAGGEVSQGYRAPMQALAFARHLARTDVPLAGLLRSYRLGQELLFTRAADLADGDTSGLREVGLLTFRFVDSVVGEVTEAFELEREAVLRGSDLRRERLVARLLAGEEPPATEVERILGRRLRGSHLAAVAWAPDLEVDAEVVTAGLRRALAWTGDGTALVMPGAAGEVYGWVRPTEHRAPVEELTSALVASGVRVALGDPAEGLAGFVSSRRQAEAARGVARHLPQQALVQHRDVGLLILLLADPAAAAQFAAAELGALRDGEHDVLRTTVLAYLEHGRDTTATAGVLDVHRNTVMRRISRAEELIGHPLHERSAEVLVALLIAGARGDRSPARRWASTTSSLRSQGDDLARHQLEPFDRLLGSGDGDGTFR